MIKINTSDYLNNLQLELYDLNSYINEFDTFSKTLNSNLFYVNHSIYFYLFKDNEYLRTRYLNSVQGVDLLTAKQLQFNINQKLSIPNAKIINQIEAYEFDLELKKQKIYEIENILNIRSNS